MRGARHMAFRRLSDALAFVLDSSVILAIVRGESGADRALALAKSRSFTSSVNVAEMVTKCIQWNYPEAAALGVVANCGMEVVAFTHDHAVLAGQLRRLSERSVLSLGDRACIATAMRLNATVVTADRIWASLDIDCPVELIR